MSDLGVKSKVNNDVFVIIYFLYSEIGIPIKFLNEKCTLLIIE
jgi:hypothetical protein